MYGVVDSTSILCYEILEEVDGIFDRNKNLIILLQCYFFFHRRERREEAL
jgi:hypothetical protein